MKNTVGAALRCSVGDKVTAQKGTIPIKFVVIRVLDHIPIPRLWEYIYREIRVSSSDVNAAQSPYAQGVVSRLVWKADTK